MISVDQLAAVPSLGLRYLAGSRGGARLVTWAHACDLPDPWNWFQAGDLVMTTGGGMPSGETAQREWMSRLIDGKVSALVVALSPAAPKVTARMLDTAEEHGFPVLAASYDVQFVSLARTVIESAIEAERRQLSAIRKIYEVYWLSLHARGTLDERLAALEVATGRALEVRDADSGESLAVGHRASLAQHGDRERNDTVDIAVPGTQQVVLRAAVGGDSPMQRQTLEHLSGLIALELEHTAAQQDRLRASGQDLIAGLLDESITLAAVWPELRHRGMGGDIVVACWSNADGSVLRHEAIHRHLCMRDYAPLLLAREASLVGIVPHDIGLLTRVASELGTECAVGVSAPLTANSRLAEAIRQARLSVARAHERRSATAIYGEDDEPAATFLPTSVEDLRRIVSVTLGPLIEHDRRSDGDLVQTVRVFLNNDGSWKLSAEQLNIHRQTLVYRLKRVAALTGLSPTTTQGAARLWLALAAADRAEMPLDDIGL